MKLNDLNNKNIALLGLGAENYYLALFLLKEKVNCKITICDARNGKKLGEKFLKLKKYKNVFWRLGKNYDADLSDFDLVFRSPGYPLHTLKTKNIYSAMNLFFDLCPTKNIIGITGTKGKGTSSSLIYNILKQAGKNVFLGGNIGVAPFSFLSKIKKNDFVVLELSSFQLQDLKTSPRFALITNFSREHLAPADPNNPNYHKTMQEYWRAKANVFSHPGNKKLIANYKLRKKIKKDFLSFSADKPKSNSYFKNKEELIVKTNKTQKIKIKNPLPGKHNQENIAGAILLAKILKISNRDIAKAIENFKSLPYRIEFIAQKNKINFYNDSFATTPEATITALKSFQNPIILIAGGSDKNSDFTQLAKEIKKRVKFLILFTGKGSNRIKKELGKINFKKIKNASSMSDALQIAKEKAQAGNTILLSPACASFGIFKNYKDRGKQFTDLIKTINF